MTSHSLPALLLAVMAPALHCAERPGSVLDPEAFRHHVVYFNRMAPEDVVNYVPDARAWEWMKDNVPRFTCPDADVERTYYYRWWAFRKHLKQTPAGFLFTEFLRPVGHATDYNAISCALGHHIGEGRWLRDRRYLDQYLQFWLRSGDHGGLQRGLHQYSGWVAAAAYDRWLTDGNTKFLVSLLDSLILDYRTWEQDRLLPSGLFWQYDVRDGMEESISGSRTQKHARPTINSYMYGNARALAALAGLAGKPCLAREYQTKADRLRALVQERLWDPQARFFKSLLASGELAGVREQIGYTPWYFGLPEPQRGYEEAWRQLMDPKGFYAPYGPTTAEQRHAAFQIAERGDDCQWNGPSWPFSTTVTLKALANVLNDYPQTAIGGKDYFQTFLIYTRSHRRTLEDGRVIPWIDENLNPFTGEWHARAMKIRKGTFNGRGDHYHHSGYADLVITGVVGLRPRPDDVVEVNPLAPADAWEWFALDNVPYHGQTLTILWDRTGAKFGRGRGLRVLAGGREIAHAPELRRVRGRLPGAPASALEVSPNRRFLQYRDGTPFFWLGDTAWLLFQRLDRAEAERYLEQRRRQGFNVVQAVVLHSADDRNAYGSAALTGGDPARPNVTPGRDPSQPGEYDYWDHVDWILDRAADKGLFVALIAAWGSVVNRGALNAGNVAEYAAWLAERYRSRPNIVWVVGGDTRGDKNGEVWQAMGRAFKRAAPGHLVTYHPFGRTQSSTWFHDEPWLDFNMFQSGHRRYDQDTESPQAKGEDNWRYVAEDYDKRPPKPTLDGEPSYEGIPQGLHDPTQPYWTAADVRRYAYWSVFAGAFGHTYGHNAVMQMHKPGVGPGAYGVRSYWYDAITDPGAGQMQFLKRLMLSRPFFERIPDQGLIAGDNGVRYERVIATRGKAYAFIYTYTGRPFRIRMGILTGSRVRAAWFQPRDGSVRPIGVFANRGERRFVPPGAPGPGNDWVLVLDDADAGFPQPGR